ncbi:MAG: hypothetical protein COB94_005065 [Gammaproteobacteria bacterium]|nr:hypothetical protein [Gammaproteobacteria bacterium]
MEGTSQYIVYVDESSDDGMEGIDLDYPVFVLALCVFDKSDYTSSISPAMQRFKCKYFGHDITAIRLTFGEFS